MRILLINPNTSEFVTAAVTAEAKRAAAAGTEIQSVTGAMGPPIISCRSENAIGTHTAMELAADHVAGCDAIVLAVSFDSALAELRAVGSSSGRYDGSGDADRLYGRGSIRPVELR